MRRILAVIKKETSHILRDPKSLVIVFVMPVMMIFMYGYAISFDLNNIDIGVSDFSRSEISKKLVSKFLNNGYFTLKLTGTGGFGNSLSENERLLKEGKIKAYIIIPKDFSKKISSMDKTEVSFVIDGSDSNSANIIYQYCRSILMNFISEYQDIKKFMNIKSKIFFNPALKSAFFFIPGIIAILLLMVSAMLTSLSISRESETGSIELLFISPLRSGELIVGKTFSYIFVAFSVEILIILFGKFWFQIPFKGSLLVLFLFSLIYILTGLSLGILISASASDQKTAMLGTLLVTMLPSIMLSGFIFPLESLNPFLRSLSHIVPATYFLRIIRGVILKGSDLTLFIREGVILFGMSIFLIMLAIVRFRRKRSIAG